MLLNNCLGDVQEAKICKLANAFEDVDTLSDVLKHTKGSHLIEMLINNRVPLCLNYTRQLSLLSHNPNLTAEHYNLIATKLQAGLKSKDIEKHIEDHIEIYEKIIEKSSMPESYFFNFINNKTPYSILLNIATNQNTHNSTLKQILNSSVQNSYIKFAALLNLKTKDYGLEKIYEPFFSNIMQTKSHKCAVANHLKNEEQYQNFLNLSKDILDVINTKKLILWEGASGNFQNEVNDTIKEYSFYKSIEQCSEIFSSFNDGENIMFYSFALSENIIDNDIDVSILEDKIKALPKFALLKSFSEMPQDVLKEYNKRNYNTFFQKLSKYSNIYSILSKNKYNVKFMYLKKIHIVLYVTLCFI